MDILYTDTDQIRGCLFIEPQDLPDRLFNVTLLERELQLDLDSWLPAHASLVALDSTAGERSVANKIKSYVTYWVACYITVTLSLSFPQKIGDGKNSRELGADHVIVQDTLLARVATLRAELIADTGGVVPAPLKLVTTVDLAKDPVTSDGT